MQEAKKRRFGIIFTTLFLISLCNVFGQNGPDDSLWVPIFNGKDIDDWEFKIRGQQLGVDPNNTFIYENGMLRVDYSNYTNFNGEPFGHIAYKVKEFSHYIITIEYRFVGSQVSGGPGWALQNNGIMFHSQSMESMTLNQDFPVSMEAQLLGPDRGRTMNLCTPGTRYHNMQGGLVTAHCTNAQNHDISGTTWMTASMVVLGDSLVKHIVETDTVLTYQGLEKDNGSSLAFGYITFQAESHSTDFRKVEVLDLEGCMNDSASNYKSYFVQDSAAACVFPVPIQAKKGLFPDYVKWDGINSISVSAIGEYSINIVDVTGTVVLNHKKTGSSSIVLNNQLSSGVYSLLFKHEGSQFSKKIVILP